MKILGIDTSTHSLGIALVEDGKLLVSIDKILGLRHSQDLIPMVQSLLREHSLEIADIDCFAVSRGPGSFTGLRVGVAVVKALALVEKKPVVGVPTLDVIAQNVCYFEGLICPLMDAKKQKVYAALYRQGRKTLRRMSPYLLVSIDELLKRIRTKTLFVGDGIRLYGATIQKKRKKAEFAHERLWLPKAEHVALLGWEQFKKGKIDKPLDLVPLYLHSRECNVTQ
jgi:tRNA threonylcarbamoyladenosine biosynthesis protein TsaB